MSIATNKPLYVIVCGVSGTVTNDFMLTKTDPNEVLQTVTDISTGKHSSQGKATIKRIFTVDFVGKVNFYEVQFVDGKLHLVWIKEEERACQ